MQYRISPWLVPAACVASRLFEGAVRVRNGLYESGALPQRQLPHPVVSIGNLTAGGAGKTPLAICLAQIISRMGRVPILLSRGYRRQTRMDLILGPEEPIAAPAQTLGDEPALIRRHLPEIWLGIGARRYKIGNRITGRVARPVFILDDGFQHLRLRRDLNILVIDRFQPLACNRVLPLGSLREPLCGMRRADVVVINGAPPAQAPDPVEAEVRSIKPEAAIFHCVQQIDYLAPILLWKGHGRECNPGPISGPAFLVAAIGNPDRFYFDIRALDIEVVGARFLRDHAAPGPADWRAFAAEARAQGAAAIITTEKDAIKLVEAPDFPLLVAVQSTRIFEQAEWEKRLYAIMEADR
jgi:tetraacyldisaccharide 4'-kinase